MAEADRRAGRAARDDPCRRVREEASGGWGDGGASGVNGGPKIGSFFLSAAKSYLVTAKQLMRRIRDKVPYSQGDRMMLNAGS